MRLEGSPLFREDDILSYPFLISVTMLSKRDFQAEKPFSKCVTDITEIKANNGKLYVSAVFDCFDSSVVGLANDGKLR